MEELRSILIKPQVKATILALFTIAIGIISSAAVNHYKKIIMWIILVVIIILYFVVLTKYTKKEEDLNKRIQELMHNDAEAEKLFRVFASSIQGINAMCKLSAKQTNLKIHEIEDQGKIYCDNWNFDIASSLVCEQIYNHVITHICDNNGYNSIADVEVGYVSIVEKKTKRKKKQPTLIKLCGFYHPSRQSPSVYRVVRETNKKDRDGKLYHDAVLFEKRRNATDVLMSSEDIVQEFGFLSHNNDYCQYIGIPVFCDTVDNGNKMVGLLEIVCHNKCYLSTKEEDIRKYVDFYLSPYVSLLLLLFKNDKALRAMPKKP